MTSIFCRSTPQKKALFQPKQGVIWLPGHFSHIQSQAAISSLSLFRMPGAKTRSLGANFSIIATQVIAKLVERRSNTGALQCRWFYFVGCWSRCYALKSWGSKGTPPMPPPQEIRPYYGMMVVNTRPCSGCLISWKRGFY